MNGNAMQPLILRILPFALASLVLAACGEEPPEVAEQIRAIKTITITQLATGQERRYSGIVQATDSSSLSFQVSGNVKSVAVERGERVTKGQVLAALDTKPYERSQDQTCSLLKYFLMRYPRTVCVMENDLKLIGSRMGMTVAAGRDRLAIFHTVRQARTPFGQ